MGVISTVNYQNHNSTYWPPFAGHGYLWVCFDFECRMFNFEFSSPHFKKHSINQSINKSIIQKHTWVFMGIQTK
jgi:hypothetical protein